MLIGKVSLEDSQRLDTAHELQGKLVRLRLLTESINPNALLEGAGYAAQTEGRR